MGFYLFYDKWWRSSDEKAGPMDPNVVNCVWAKTKKERGTLATPLCAYSIFFLPTLVCRYELDYCAV